MNQAAASLDNSDLGTTISASTADIEAPALNTQAASAEAPRTSFIAGLGGGIKSGFKSVGHGITDGVDSIGKGVTKGFDKTAALVGLGSAAEAAVDTAAEEERKKAEAEAA